MNKDGGKVVLVSLSIVAAILFCSTVAFYAMEETERAKKNLLQKKFDNLAAVKEALESKLKDSEAAVTEFKARLKSQEDTIASTTQALDEAKRENDKNVFKLQERENEVRAITARLDSEKAEKDNLLAKVQTTSEERDKLKSQLDVLLKAKEEMDKKAKDIRDKEGVSLGTVVVDHKSK